MKENLYNNIIELIGKTPLVRLNKVAGTDQAELYVKLENFNPGSSVKDRIAYSMITHAEEDGELYQGVTIIEPTSGNTGIGLALVAAIKGYRLILTMPESMSIERRKLLISLGAEIVLTDADLGMDGAVQEALMLADNIGKTFIPQQFMNKYNPLIHYETTGPEIWQDCGGKIDYFVAGVGTGGTVSGAGKYLREQNPDIQIIAVEPVESPVISGGEMGAHMIQGIGAGFIPKNYDDAVVDRVITVDSMSAINTAKQLSKMEGIIAGISAGANVYAASKIAAEIQDKSARIVTVICDTGERYISTLLYYED